MCTTHTLYSIRHPAFAGIAAPPSVTDALDRNLIADPDSTDVHDMTALVDEVMALGSESAIGCEEMMDRMELYVNNFSCPTCHPWEFGMTRVNWSTVLALGGSDDNRADAKAVLLQCVDLLGDNEVVKMIRLQLSSIAMGRDHPWYWK